MSTAFPDYNDPRVAKAVRKAQRRWYQKKRFLIPLVLVALVFVVSVFGGRGEDPTPTAAAGPTSSAAAGSPTGEAQPAFTATSYGQVADSDGLQLTVAAPKSVNDVLGSYYCITVSYVNNSGDQARFDAYDWRMNDTEGVEVTPTFGGTKNYLGSGQLRPGGRKSGDVCFDKQGGGTPQGVTYRGGLFDSPVQWQK